MGLSVWLCVLCLQAGLLSHAFGCSEGELCAGGRTADRQHGDNRQQRTLLSAERQDLFRRKRQLERRGPTHLSHPRQPGAVSVKGFPNAVMQTDRTKRPLILAANRRRIRGKHRNGSYSLLSNDKLSNLKQVTRLRRQVKLDPSKRGKSGRSGAFSVLGDPQTDGQSDRPESNA